MVLPSFPVLLWSILIEPLTLVQHLLLHLLPTLIYRPTTRLLSAIGFDPLNSHNYGPHPSAPFEGYYTRITTETGATILVIFSWVRGAKEQHIPRMVHFSYLPNHDSSSDHSLQQTATVITVAPKDLKFLGQNDQHQRELELAAHDEKGDLLGRFWVAKNGRAKCNLELPTGDGATLKVDIAIKNRTAWGGDPGDVGPGPEGPLASLKYLLPLHWYVWSVASDADVRIERVQVKKDGENEYVGSDLVLDGRGRAHMEKNWGATFPTGWVWIQSLAPSSPGYAKGKYERLSIPDPTPPHIALAGGSILGLKAFLVGFSAPALARETGYCTKNIAWTFRPGFTVLFPFLRAGRWSSPFCREDYSCADGTFKLHVVDWKWSTGWRKLVLTVSGAPGVTSSTSKELKTTDYIELACPVTQGHDNNFAKETFSAKITVEAYQWERLDKNGWHKVVHQDFKNGALEWGGGYWGTKSLEGKENDWLSTIEKVVNGGMPLHVKAD